MRKVIYGGGLFTFKDIEGIHAPERYVTLVEITPPDEEEAMQKYIAERVKAGTLHPRKRPRAI